MIITRAIPVGLSSLTIGRVAIIDEIYLSSAGAIILTITYDNPGPYQYTPLFTSKTLIFRVVANTTFRIVAGFEASTLNFNANNITNVTIKLRWKL